MRRACAATFGLLALVSVARAEPVRIGIGAPLSGPDGVFGDEVRLGVEQAISDLNAADGILGKKVQAMPRDDGNDPKKGADVAKAFVAAGVGFVVGHLSSSVTVPASAIYADAGIVDITPSAAAPLVTDRELPTIFRTCGRDDQQAAAAVAYLIARHVGRVAILHDRTTSGKALADAVRTGLAKAGRQDVLYASIEKGSHDATSVVGRLRASGAQIAFWGGGGTEAGLLARQLREANVKVVILGGIAMASDDFAATAGPAAEGTLMVFPRDPRALSTAADLLHRLQANGKDPGAYVFTSYAAVEVLHQAAEAAHSLDPKKVAETMRSGIIFKTVIGDLAFDAKGDPTMSDLAVFVWRKGASGRMTFDDLARS